MTQEVFISEIDYSGDGAGQGDEFIEITVSNNVFTSGSADDYVISFWSNGTGSVDLATFGYPLYDQGSDTGDMARDAGGGELQSYLSEGEYTLGDVIRELALASNEVTTAGTTPGSFDLSDSPADLFAEMMALSPAGVGINLPIYNSGGGVANEPLVIRPHDTEANYVVVRIPADLSAANTREPDPNGLDPDYTGEYNAQAITLVNTNTNDVIQAYDFGNNTTIATIPAAGSPTGSDISTETFDFGTGGVIDDDLVESSGSTRMLASSTTGSSVINSAVCFTQGTWIETPSGPVPVEELTPGDLVSTRRGPRPVRLVVHRDIEGSELRADCRLLPVRFSANALGLGKPIRDLAVSRQHRVLLSSTLAQCLTGRPEALIAAIHLTALPGVEVMADVKKVQYFHILFDDHEIVYSHGLATESLFLGAMAVRSIPRAQRDEIEAIFPMLRDGATPSAPTIPFLSGKEQKNLVAQYAKGSSCSA